MRRRACIKLISAVAAGGTCAALLEPRLQLGRRLLQLLRSPGNGLHKKTILSMGTFVTISMYEEDTRERPHAIDQALDEFRTVDALMSIFKPDSDVARVNGSAGERSVTVDRRVCDVVGSAIEMGDRSGGIFDMTVLPLLRAYESRNDSSRRLDPEELSDVLSAVDYRQVIVDRQKCQIGIESRAARIDLGGIAKGYAVDRAADVLRANGIRNAVIEAGGDIFALGSPRDGDAWPIGVQHPLRSDKLAGTVRLSDQAIATSGNYEASICVGEKRYGHLFDPRTGYPSESMLSASVTAPTALTADALATTAFLMGCGDGTGLIREQRGMHSLFITGGPEGGIEYETTNGFPMTVTGSEGA